MKPIALVPESSREHLGIPEVSVRAGYKSVGGVLLLILGIVAIAASVSAWLLTDLDGMQRGIAIGLSAVLLLFLVDAGSESIHLTPTELEVRSWISRQTMIDLRNISDMRIHAGSWFGQSGRPTLWWRNVGESWQRLYLSPTWDRRTLVELIKVVSQE